MFVVAAMRLRQDYLLCELRVWQIGSRHTFGTMTPVICQEAEVMPVILSTACWRQALCSGQFWEPWLRKHLQEERILRKEMCKTCYRGCDCWSLPSYQKHVQQKRNEHWAGLFQTPPTLDGESWGENNSEPQHLMLNHPDFLHQA